MQRFTEEHHVQKILHDLRLYNKQMEERLVLDCPDNIHVLILMYARELELPSAPQKAFTLWLHTFQCPY